VCNRFLHVFDVKQPPEMRCRYASIATATATVCCLVIRCRWRSPYRLTDEPANGDVLAVDEHLSVARRTALAERPDQTLRAAIRQSDLFDEALDYATLLPDNKQRITVSSLPLPVLAA
jgi:hypothetical protein